MRGRAVIGVIFIAVGTTFGAVPATQPAKPVANRVLIVPFQPVDPAEASATLSRGMSAHLQSVIARTPFAPSVGNAVCDDPTAARGAGKSAGSAFVIYGSYQRVDTRVRFDGGLVNVDTGDIVTGLTATGDVEYPFECEDRIAAQAIAGLRGGAANSPEANAAPDATTALSAPAVAPPAMRPAYAPLVAMLDRNRTQSNDNLARIQRSTDRQTFYPGAFGYGGYLGYGGFGYFGGVAGFGGFGGFEPGAVIGGTDYSNAGYAPYANYRVGYGVAGSAPP